MTHPVHSKPAFFLVGSQRGSLEAAANVPSEKLWWMGVVRSPESPPVERPEIQILHWRWILPEWAGAVEPLNEPQVGRAQDEEALGLEEQTGGGLAWEGVGCVNLGKG